MLERRQRTITGIYFPESGFASVVANGSSGQPIEAGLIGREGMTGLAVVLDADRPRHDTFIQAAGTGLCMTAAKLRAAIAQSTSLHRSLCDTRTISRRKRRRRRWPMAGARSRNGWRVGF
jgi:CRP-like cAMP-binding protein